MRSFVLPGESARFNGHAAFRADLHCEVVPAIVRVRGLAMRLGPGRYLLYYARALERSDTVGEALAVNEALAGYGSVRRERTKLPKIVALLYAGALGPRRV
ncbi:MAG: hypothetical protein ACFCVK_03190 [Acidimicrobiales bacterium]